MATVPLIRNKNDVYYRYQMPKLIAKIEGSGNGIRTVITNMALIAKAINRPGTYVTKFFGYELGAQVKTDQNIYSVNGSHDAEKLLSLLYSFIEKFVLCSSCENPETDLTVSKKQISLKCKACGSITTISERTHKLTTFIVNHPPEDSSKKDSKDSKDSKSGKKKTKKSEDGKSTSKKSSEQKSDSVTVSSGGDKIDDAFEDDDFGEDFNPDPNVINNLAEEFKTVKVDSMDCGERFYEMVKQKVESNQLGIVQVQKDLVVEATNLGIRDKSCLVLCEALFNENVNEQIKPYRNLVLRFCMDNKKAQKYLLGGFEKLVEKYPKLLPATPKILKEFYDNDLIEEGVFYEFFDKPTKKYVPKDLSKVIHEKAAPFIKWLKEAEEEDDSDEEPSVKPKAITTNNNGTSNNKTPSNADNDEDEDDDDDDAGIDFSHRVSGIQVETIKEKKKEDEVDDSFIDAI